MDLHHDQTRGNFEIRTHDFFCILTLAVQDRYRQRTGKGGGRYKLVIVRGVGFRVMIQHPPP